MSALPSSLSCHVIISCDQRRWNIGRAGGAVNMLRAMETYEKQIILAAVKQQRCLQMIRNYRNFANIVTRSKH